jgi:hypothetical protein
MAPAAHRQRDVRLGTASAAGYAGVVALAALAATALAALASRRPPSKSVVTWAVVLLAAVVLALVAV